MQRRYWTKSGNKDDRVRGVVPAGTAPSCDHSASTAENMACAGFVNSLDGRTDPHEIPPSTRRPKIAYFPSAYPEETVYSLLARYARHLGGSYRPQLLRPVLARPPRCRALHSFADARDLVAILPSPAMDLVTFVERHTILPYYYSVIAEQHRGEAYATRIRSNPATEYNPLRW